MIYKRPEARNAEITIDYENKKVDFKYPTKEHNKYLGYFAHNITQIIGLITATTLTYWWLLSLPKLQTFNINQAIYRGSILLFIFIGTIYLIGHISIILHLLIPKLRENYPQYNNIIPRKWKEIDLSKERFENIIKLDNQLIFIDYSIVYFQYEYKGDNKISKIRTISINEQNKKEHYNFILIMQFQRTITEGTLRYRT